MAKDDIFGILGVVFYLTVGGYFIWKYGINGCMRFLSDSIDMVLRRIIYGPQESEQVAVIEPHSSCKHEETEPVETLDGEVIGHMCTECFKLLKKPRFKIVRDEAPHIVTKNGKI